MMKKKILLVLSVLTISTATQAAVYICGNGSYSSKPGPGCHNASLPSIGSYSSARVRPVQTVSNNTSSQASRSSATHNTSARNSAPARNTTSVQPASYQTAAPSARTNSGRRVILEQELANERRALDTAQKALTESRAMPQGSGAAYQAYQARISNLQSDVLDRQQNIQALQRELSRM